MTHCWGINWNLLASGSSLPKFDSIELKVFSVRHVKFTKGKAASQPSRLLGPQKWGSRYIKTVDKLPGPQPEIQPQWTKSFQHLGQCVACLGEQQLPHMPARCSYLLSWLFLLIQEQQQQLQLQKQHMSYVDIYLPFWFHKSKKMCEPPPSAVVLSFVSLFFNCENFNVVSVIFNTF